MNKLFFGDNLAVLREHIKDESADLIYLDPPFKSDATYNVLFDDRDGIPSEAQAEAFRDTWRWGESAAIAYDDITKQGGDLSLLMAAFRAWLGDSSMMAYLSMMAVRLIELRRALKPSGSLYLHCDPSASHYIKIVMDGIFGHSFFRNEICWKRTGAHGSSKRWGPVHDVILFYTASEEYTWNRVFQDYEPGYIASKYRHKDARGNFQDVSLTGPGTRNGESGSPWRRFNPTEKGRHWAVPGAIGASISGFGDMTQQEQLDALDVAGLIYWPKARSAKEGFPRVKQYPAKGNTIQDVVTDIPAVNSQARERLGYPTQKPVDLLVRIIEASSGEGATVLDPFCGCGTSVEAAERLGRQWVGIDVTHYAITLIEKRLKRFEQCAYDVGGRPTDMAGAQDLARRDKYQFQWWAAWLLGAQTYESKKGADRGIDANMYFANGPFGFGRIILSVKGGENVSPVWVRELAGVVDREQAQMGILITLNEPTRSMKSEAAGLGFVQKSAHGRLPKVQIATIQDLLDKRFPQLPPLPRPLVTAPRRKSARDRDQLEMVLPFKTTTILTEDGVFIDPRFVAAR